MNYTQEQFNNATFISNTEYLTMDNLTFEGQTRANSDGKYKMYWSDPHGNLYVTHGTL